MIRRIGIQGYKSFTNLDVRLGRLSVILGPNASGKSNLLDAVYLLSRAGTCHTLKEAFEGHRGLPLESFYYGDTSYEDLLKRDRIALTLEADVELSPDVCRRVSETVLEKRKGVDAGTAPREFVTERFLRYRLVIEALPQTGYVRVADERLAAIRRDGREKRSRKPFIEKVGERIRLRMEGQARPTDHEIGLDYTLVSTSLYEPHYPHITAFRTELQNWMVYYLEPRTLMREEVPLAAVTALGPRGENLAALLNLIKVQTGTAFDALNLALRRVLPIDARIDTEITKEGRVGLRLWENGRWYSGRLISEGTLRLIGLLLAIHPASRSTLVAYEEPENGVHPVRLKIMADLLRNAAAGQDKQILVTTHSPIFPEYFDNSELFVSRKDAGGTVICPFSHAPGELFRRSNIEHALEDRILRGDLGG